MSELKNSNLFLQNVIEKSKDRSSRDKAREEQKKHHRKQKLGDKQTLQTLEDQEHLQHQRMCKQGEMHMLQGKVGQHLQIAATPHQGEKPVQQVREVKNPQMMTDFIFI